MLARPVEPDDSGTLVLSDAPGLGIALDEDRLARTKVGGDAIRSNN
jgi:L-alanine-DL-glutamate epimerase-like enolase superfamily enzyme